MNGARADPSVNTMSAPRRSRINIIGASQNFFLTLRKSQNSAAIDGLCIFSNSYFIIGKIFYRNNERLCKYFFVLSATAMEHYISLERSIQKIYWAAR
ncbi:hypothetical protein MNBD_NITROSPINAE03-335 [hydrothermal vent metagenome]|uniref:Uncharacterized protein n=1 Tax=hydrothermal vent metagenome TaxID=652676 RepID=A0A3B1BRS5_9ZZZZ